MSVSALEIHGEQLGFRILSMLSCDGGGGGACVGIFVIVLFLFLFGVLG